VLAIIECLNPKASILKKQKCLHSPRDPEKWVIKLPIDARMACMAFHGARAAGVAKELPEVGDVVALVEWKRQRL
jgi:hypothetical protein